MFIGVDCPVYMGISRGVDKRLIQHFGFESRYTSSQVYRMAKAMPPIMKGDTAHEG